MEYADRVLKNGKIYTVDSEFRVLTAMAVRKNRIAYVGDDTGILDYIGPQTEVIDLEGKCVTPGFIDNHVHAREVGYTRYLLSCEELTKEEILEKIKEEIETLSPGQWMVSGTGWDNDWWVDPRYPSIEELDAVSPENPVLLRRKAGGVVWVNTQALIHSGFTGKDDPRVTEACIVNDDGRRASGCLVGPVANIIRSKVPQSGVMGKNDPLAQDEFKKKCDIEALLATEKYFFQMGLTAFTDARQQGAELEVTENLYREGKLKIRMYCALHDGVGSDPDLFSKEYLKKCPIIGAYGDRFTVRTIKLGAGGTFGSRTAGMYEPFTDNPGNCGTPKITDEELYRCMREGAEHGMQIMIHTIGDRDIDRVLAAYEKLNREYPVFNARHRIEHYQLIRGNSPERTKALGIIPSMQALHGPNSANMAERCLGPYRAPVSYPIGQICRRVGIVAGGSDAPVANPNPLSGIHASVTRKNDFMQPKGGFYAAESAMSREDALRSFTIWGAYAQFAEERYGSLEPGKYADYVIMDQDIMEVEADDIIKIRILETVLDGETVYRAD